MFKDCRDEHETMNSPSDFTDFWEECCADGRVRFHSQTPGAEVEMGMIFVPFRKMYQ